MRRIEMEEYVSPKELCKLLKVSGTWPYKMIQRGGLPYYKIEGIVRFKKSDIEAFLEGYRVEAKERMEVKKKDKVHSAEAKQTTGICRGCFKRTDGRIDYLIDGFCETCRPRPNLCNTTRRESRA
jgi:excisionase family DNA binding protein